MSIFPIIILGFTIDGWTLFGFFAQFLFFLRMMVQWVSSERARKSVIPISYWYLSVVGSFLVFVYAVKIRNPVFTLGQLAAVSIYVRNIYLYKKHRHSKSYDMYSVVGYNEHNITSLERGQVHTNLTQDYRLNVLFSMIPKNGDTLVDIGSGNGEVANFRKGDFTTFYLYDKSSYIINHLQKKFADRNDVIVGQLTAENFNLSHVNTNIFTLTDIIEHTKNDGAVLKNVYESLSAGGTIFLSVPAHPFLYGKRDKHAGHFRRYRKKELKQRVEDAGFIIQKISYWNLLGVLPYIFSEKILKKEISGFGREVTGFGSLLINRIILSILTLEKYIPFLPFGLTLIVIARKPNNKKNVG